MNIDCLTFSNQTDKDSLIIFFVCLREKDVPSIKKYFTNYTIMKVPKAGHTIHFDNPSFTMKTINEFINK